MELIVSFLTALFTGLTVLTMLRPNIGIKVSKHSFQRGELQKLEIELESDKAIQVIGFKIDSEIIIYRSAFAVTDGFGHAVGWERDASGSVLVAPVGTLTLFKNERARFNVWLDSDISLDEKRISLIARSSNVFWRIKRTVEIP